MNRRRYAGAAKLAALAGLVVAAPALAQDATKPPQPPQPTRAVTTVQPQQPASAREDATRTVPTYEAFGAESTESTTESMYRLSRDFAATSELGVSRLGQVPVWPRGDVKIGPVRILPYVREGVEYVSNFYRVDRTGPNGSPNANDAVWTHTNQLGILADSAHMGGRLRLAASIDARWNLRYDSGNSSRGQTLNRIPIDADKQDTFEFDGQVGASYRWPQGTYLRGGVAYERRADPIDVDLTREFQRTNRRMFVTAGMDKDVLFGTKFRYEAGVNIRDTIGREKGLDALDRTEAMYYLKASYPFWKDRTRVFARGRYRRDERESNQINDGHVYGFDAGLEGTIPLSEGEYRGLRGQVSVGFDHALYEDEEFFAGSDRRIRDSDDENTSVAISATLQYIMSRKTAFDLRYLRTNQFTFHGNYQVVDRLDLTATHNITRALTGRVATFFEYDDPSGLLEPQEVGQPRRSGDYPATTRFGAGCGLRYRINEWMDIDGSFDWERRNNRISGFVNHRASLGLTFYLNALKPRARTEDSIGLAAARGEPRTSTGAAPRMPEKAAPPAPSKTTQAPPAMKTPEATRTATRPPEPPRAAKPTAPTVAPPRAPSMEPPASHAGVDVRPTGRAKWDGRELRLEDDGARARVTFPDGATMDVLGPARMLVRSVDATGYRVLLLQGMVPEARALGTALEIQTGPDGWPSLVLQDAVATASRLPNGEVKFTPMGGNYLRVFTSDKDTVGTPISTAPWTRK